MALQDVTPPSLLNVLTRVVSKAFAMEGADPSLGRVIVSNRLDLCDVQSNGAFAAAKALGMPPHDFATRIAQHLHGNIIFREVSAVGAYLNMTLSDDFLMTESGQRLGTIRAANPLRIVIDYGGANIAKPLHVGHLRSAIIGESLKRIARALGHEVVGDVHLGDWGLQMGMVLHELSQRHPDWPYFSEEHLGEFPTEPAVSRDELDEIYPSASIKAKTDADYLTAARRTTAALQRGHAGYRALWQSIVNVSVEDLRRDYTSLNVFFDLWYGESTVNDLIPRMVQELVDDGFAHESAGALVIDVALPDDRVEIPPFILQKSDGAMLYSTTDLATIALRVKENEPDVILYVIDKRQATHLLQVFRAAWKTGIAPKALQMEHTGFGTMNGPDGKPFKTRAGGTMKLKDLIDLVTLRATTRIEEAEVAQSVSSSEERDVIARKVGIATLKFADLSNARTTDYIFDVDRFSSFEGRTGPYLLYTAVRARSILHKAAERGLEAGDLLQPRDEVERNVFFSLALFRDRVLAAFASRAPSEIAEYAYDLASTFGRYYHEHHILSESNSAVRASALALVRQVATTLEQALDLLGIEIPERM
jgi:arginyl-tRNA synthetase